MAANSHRASLQFEGSPREAARRGIEASDILEAREMRRRRYGWQTIAAILGMCREDIQAAVETGRKAAPAPVAPKPILSATQLEGPKRPAHSPRLGYRPGSLYHRTLELLAREPCTPTDLVVGLGVTRGTANVTLTTLKSAGFCARRQRGVSEITTSGRRELKRLKELS